MHTPVTFYQENISKYTQEKSKIQSAKKLIGWGRFALIIGIFAWTYTQWTGGWPPIVIGDIIGIIAFLWLVSVDTNKKEELDYVNELIHINQEEIAILDFQFTGRKDGAAFAPENHAYAADLDIFGKHSLFQYINRAQTEGGEAKLAQWLTAAANKKTIELRQQAAQQIATIPDWSQQLEAYGALQPIDLQMNKNIGIWLSENEPYQNPFWQLFRFVFPVITLTTLYLYLDNVISGGIFSLLILVFLVTAFSISKKINPIHVLLSKFVPKVTTLSHLIQTVEKLDTGNATLLDNIQQQVKSGNGNTASNSLQQLGKILGRFDVRLNVFAYIILNTFLLWDLHQIFALRKWKQENGARLPQWLENIYYIEALNSLAVLRFNQTSWVMPVITDGYFELSGTQIGHPLIQPEKRVDNSFSINGQGQIGLITGSNMGGKSTFLRSLGVNLALAYAGAPVCAEKFSTSVARLMSSMRIADNLSENTSTFYAELKKLRAIIEAVNNGEKVFILLDEILRGTNSLDRHAGSKALMLQLIKQKSVAVIATHDVELANLVHDFPQSIQNYHFDVQVNAENELFFDYRLKPGVCQRMNASILMKQIGIEM